MRILVARDDAPLAELLHPWLLQEPFAVERVSTGPAAQRMASPQSYDLVVLALNRSGTVRLDALRGIRSKQPDQPVIARKENHEARIPESQKTKPETPDPGSELRTWAPFG